MTSENWHGMRHWTTIVGFLQQEYIGSAPHPSDNIQWVDMVRESVRRAMRDEHELYLKGLVSKGRVAETQGHAVLLGKIRSALERGEDFSANLDWC